jgi:NAD(P)H-quinone oxidoreductase subunit 6
MNSVVEILNNITFPDLIFCVFAAMILCCGIIVVFSKNIVHSGFSLLGTFAGVAGLYALASADFIAAAQFLIYVGGVLIVILFAIMLTRGIQDVRVSNASISLVPATTLGAMMAVLLSIIAWRFPWKMKAPAEIISTVEPIGTTLLQKYLVPFEVLSLLLLAALVGAVMIIRKEIKTESEEETH